jgi:steroid delta-isomerase-like uncharacterized protein
MHDTTAAENQAIVRTLFEDCFNRGKLDLLEQLVSPDFLPDYAGAQGARGRKGFQFIVGLRAAFPDVHYTIDEIFAAGDKVAIRWHWTGTHRGEFRGVAPSEKTVSTKGIGVFRLRGRRIVGASLETDRLGFLQQLGVMASDDRLLKPPPPPPT